MVSVKQEEGKDMVRRMDRKRMPPESEAKQRAADGAPSAEAGDRRVSHEQLHTQHDSQDGEVHDTTVVPEIKLRNLLRAPMPC